MADKKTTEIIPSTTTKKFTVRHDVIVRKPFMTEKSITHQGLAQYTFQVDKNADKVMIKKAIFNLYGVMPVHVNTLIRAGKAVRSGKYSGTRNDIKKAIVMFKKGTTLDLTK